MIIEREKSPILTNMGGGKKFGMEATAEAFAMLSGLYVNKIKAIVRELGCNAFDSHVEAGKKDIPFEVTLPTKLEPWFTIRDYGIGLDADGVDAVYTVYFKSTKRSTNDADGTLGIGSKSPFSYTDQFFVNTVKNGTYYSYQMLLDEERCPDYIQMASGHTDAPNGVEIRIPVAQNDIYNFRNEVESVYKWFDVPPVITNGHAIRKVELSDNPSYDFISHCKLHRGFYALMGNVLYDIDVSELKLDENETNPAESEFYNRLLRNGHCVILKFPRGDVNFLPSREALSFDKKTNARIKEAIISAANHAADLHLSEYESVESFDAMSDMNKDFFFEFFFERIKYKGYFLSEYDINFFKLVDDAQCESATTRQHIDNFVRNVKVFERFSQAKTVRLEPILQAQVIKPYNNNKVAIFVNEGGKYLNFLRQEVKRTNRFCSIFETTPEFLDELVGVLAPTCRVTILRQNDMIADGIKPESSYDASITESYVYDKVSKRRFLQGYKPAELREMAEIAADRGDVVISIPLSENEELSTSRLFDTGLFTIFVVPMAVHRQLINKGAHTTESAVAQVSTGEIYREMAKLNAIIDQTFLHSFDENLTFYKVCAEERMLNKVQYKIMKRAERINHYKQLRVELRKKHKISGVLVPKVRFNNKDDGYSLAHQHKGRLLKKLTEMYPLLDNMYSTAHNKFDEIKIYIDAKRRLNNENRPKSESKGSKGMDEMGWEEI